MSENLGYAATALLAFCLGVLVTILCFRLRKRQSGRAEKQKKENSDDRKH